MRIAGRFDELHVDTHRVATLLHTSFQKMSDAKLFCYLRQILRRALVMLRRCPRNDLEIGDLGQARQNFVLNAFGKITVRFVVAEILKRQHGDGFVWSWVGPSPNSILFGRYRISCAVSTEEK